MARRCSNYKTKLELTNNHIFKKGLLISRKPNSIEALPVFACKYHAKKLKPSRTC